MVYTNLHDGSDDGVQYGIDSTQKIGFFGATPVVRPTTATAVATTAVTAVATTASTNGTTNNGLFGYTTSTQANAIVTAINSLITQGNSSLTAVNTIKTNLDTLGLQG